MSASRRAFVYGGAALASAAALAQHRHPEPLPVAAGAQAPGADMHRPMKVMMEAMDAAPRTGDPDRDFLAMMIPHHQGAIDMAGLVLVHGRDPLVRQLAEEIIASQQAEIRSMVARLRILEAGRPADGFPALSGTRGR